MTEFNLIHLILPSHLKVREAFIDALKRRLKKINKQANDGDRLAKVLDSAAVKAGYKNWALFAKDLTVMSWPRFDQIQDLFEKLDILKRQNLDDDIDFDESWFDGAGD